MTEENIEQKTTLAQKIEKFHDRYYKYLLIFPGIIFLFSFIYMLLFYLDTGDFIHRDLSLTGGVIITLFHKTNINELKIGLSGRLDNFNVREVSDFITGEQKAIIIETKTNPDEAKKVIEDYLGFSLNEENSSIEFTESALSKRFFYQLLLAILIAFSLMGWVVFLIFGENTKMKVFISLPIFTNLFLSFFVFNLNLAIFSSLIVLFLSFSIYFFYSIPSIAIILSAFADIFMTLSLLNFLGIEMSSAGIVALLMLIGYSVDTDILLTNKVLKNKEDTLNKKIFSSFTTGITITLTSIVSVATTLLIVGPYSSILSKIFIVILIGLGFDLINTWITNVSILKWYILKKELR